MFKLKTTNGLSEHLTITALCYICFVHVLPMDAGRPNVGAYQVEHVLDPMTGFVTGIIPLTAVVHTLDLVPVFSIAFSDVVPSRQTCMEGYAHYYVNMFVDKDIFHVLQ